MSRKETEVAIAQGMAVVIGHPAMEKQTVPNRARTRLSLVNRATHALRTGRGQKQKRPSFFMMTYTYHPFTDILCQGGKIYF